MLKLAAGLLLAATVACSSGNGLESNVQDNIQIDDSLVDRDALVDPGNWVTVPAPLFPLIRDAEARIASDPAYDLACLEFQVGYHETDEDGDGDEYFVLVSHSEAWLRANGHFSEANGEYRGGLNYCGSDVSFEYSRTGQFLRKVCQR